jgi:hypothetical protein
MTSDAIKNFAKVDVSAGYDNAVTSIVLNTGHGAKLPDPVTDGPFNLVWWNVTDYGDPSDDPQVEIVRVTARTDDTLTIARAQEGTIATTKNTSSKSYRMILAVTRKMITDLLSKNGDIMTGSFGLPRVSKSAAYTVTASDGIIECDVTSAAFTITLPTAVGIAGRMYAFVKTDTSVNAVTIDGAGAETINGALTKTLSVQYDTLIIYSNGTNWLILHSAVYHSTGIVVPVGTDKWVP